MALDQQAQEVVDVITVGLNPPPPMLSSIFSARNLPSPADAAREAAALRGAQAGPEPVGGLTHIQIPTRDGAEILARVYTPTEGEGPFPVLVYYHGGGWVLFDLNVYDAPCRGLANAAGCVVVSVAYRQAPEHKFPTAHDDTYDAYLWVRKNAAQVNGEPDRVAVAGESVGGNMAASTALRARNEGAPLPVFQLLVYPVTNHAYDTQSYQEQADAVPLNAELMQWFFDHYLTDPSDGDNVYVSPLRAEDFSGLPPAMVITAEQDPLTSEGEAYANALRDAGVPVEYEHYEGTMHEFFSMPNAIDKARQAIDRAAEGLRAAFAGGIEGSAGSEGTQAGAGGAGAVASQVRQGMQVVGSDEGSVGEVGEIRESDFLVNRSALRLQRDVYVPFGSVREVGEDRVVLDVTADQVDDMGWEEGGIL